MLSNINMEFIQAFNPLYAIPIVAVIFCALIVYTLGFKSPIQPPSFEGLEEEKKYSKKRKTKEVQKQSKLVANGKVNGVTSTKGKVHEVGNKKELVNSSTNEKPKVTEKTAEKKVAKRTKPQNEKQQEKKKEYVTDELNDDGWVQHVSKKGKKNRKKEDNTAPEVPSSLNQSVVQRSDETAEVKVADNVPPSHVEVLNEEKKEIPKEKSLKKSNNKETSTPSPDKPAKLEISVEVKPDESYLEKDLKQLSTNIPTVSDEANKSKKKKKKPTTAPTIVEITSAAAPPPPAEIEQVTSITVAPLVTSKIAEPLIDDVPVSMPDDSKTNVVFDELAGLYPETKEKKKKKVRRDH